MDSSFNNNPVLQETQVRFFAFISKLEEKLTEFAEAAIPELTQMNNADIDKRSYHRMQSAVLGQLASILNKAQDVQEEKITCLPFSLEDKEISDAYYLFRSNCYDRYSQLENICRRYREQVEQTFSEDLEAEYQLILDEFEIIKNKFRCMQCGSPIILDKIYFTDAYISCSSCNTQNTFDPGSRAKSLEYLGRSLAEKRTEHMLEIYKKNIQQEQEMFQQMHKLEVDTGFEQNSKEKDKLTIELKNVSEQWGNIRKNSLKLYENYLRAMFDEWNRINPSLSKEHERFYQRMLDEHRETYLKN